MSQTITKMEPIQSVERAFLILETISREGSISLADLHQHLKINKASLSRLVFTLVNQGYVEKNQKTGEYSLTLKTYEIGINAVENLDKLSLINSTLVELNRKTGRIAQFSVEDHHELLCIQSIGQKSPSFSVYTNVGRRSPLYCTSAGKAILSTYSNSEIMEEWKKMNILPLTEHTITDVHEFLQEMAKVRQAQYALDREENEYQIFCVGAIVMDHTNSPIGAVSLTGTTLSKEEEQEVSQILLQGTKSLSNLLGYVG